MSKEEAQNRYIELINYLLEKHPDYTLKYGSYDDYNKHYKKSHLDNINTFERALKFFQTGKAGRGTKPTIETYIVPADDMSTSDSETPTNEMNDMKTPKNEMNNSKNDFLFNKMDQEFTATGDLKHDFGAIPKITGKETWQDNNWVNSHQAHFDLLKGITKDGFGVSYNPKYMSEDYFNWVMAPKTQYEGWKFDYSKDIDGDSKLDAAIYDKNNKLRYMNGYGLSDAREGTMADYRHKYYTNPENKGNFDNAGFLAFYQKDHPPKPKRNYESVIKAFAKNLYNKLKKLYKNNKQALTKIKNYNIKGRIESLLNRYCVLPFALLTKGYKVNDFKPAIFAEPHVKGQPNPNFSLLLSLYRDKNNLIKQVFNTQETKALLAKVVSVVIIEFNKLINENPAQFINNVIGPDSTVLGTKIYNALSIVYNQKLKLNEINVDQVMEPIINNEI